MVSDWDSYQAARLERAFRFGYCAAIGAALSRLRLSDQQLENLVDWHRRLQGWCDDPAISVDDAIPDIDGSGLAPEGVGKLAQRFDISRNPRFSGHEFLRDLMSKDEH